MKLFNFAYNKKHRIYIYKMEFIIWDVEKLKYRKIESKFAPNYSDHLERKDTSREFAWIALE